MGNKDHERDHPPQFLIGPDMPSDPASLLEDARQRIRDEDDQNKDSVKLARRLFVALILIAILGVVFYIVLPYYGVRMPPIVPMLSFLAILVATVLTGIEESRDGEPSDPQDDSPDACNNDGCATGMCPGPRPLQMFRDKKPPSKD